MEIVIDFSGYYYKNQFIIKEYCKCRLYPYTVTLSKTIVTEPPPISKGSFRNHSYSKYYRVCGINPEIGTHKIYLLRSKIKNTFKAFDTVYVKNQEQCKLLMQFLKENYTNIKCLDELGFDESREIKNLACEYHNDKINNYCASATVECMGEWLFKRGKNDDSYKPNVSKKQSGFIFNRSPTTENLFNGINHLVVNFNCNSNSKKKFIVKEMSIYVLNNKGIVVDGQFLVSQPDNSPKNLHTVVNQYNNEIMWSTGNCSEKTIKSKIEIFFMLYKMKYIFVENLAMKRKLVRIIEDDSDDIICLSDYGYNYQDEQKVSPAEQCGHHNYTNSENNECAESANRVMLKWIEKMELYKQEIVESAKSFKKVAMLGHHNILRGNSTGVNINVQLQSIDNNSNEIDDLLRCVDLSIDEILDLPYSSQHLSGSMSFSDNQLQPGYNLTDSSINNQEIHESDLEIDDEVLDTLDIENFVSSWLENKSESIDFDDILSDDRSNEQTSNSDQNSKSSDSDSDLFEKLLQSDGNKQLDDAMLNSYYEELERFLP